MKVGDVVSKEEALRLVCAGYTIAAKSYDDDDEPELTRAHPDGGFLVEYPPGSGWERKDILITEYPILEIWALPGDSHEYLIEMECKAIELMLKSKNKAYGDSAFNPIRIFSQADTVEQLKVRIDDKLSRLKLGSAAGEDTLLDLIGYLILLRIAERKGSADSQ